MLSVIFLLVAAGTPSTTLTMAQEHRLNRILVCPERLADDQARIRNTDQFMQLYSRLSPSAKAGDRMELRGRLLIAKKCRQKDSLQYTFPEP
jgi:hypothetical protein